MILKLLNIALQSISCCCSNFLPSFTEELSSYPTSAIFMDDTRVIIVSLVGSVFIVLIGSVINFLIWKRNQGEYEALTSLYIQSNIYTDYFSSYIIS